MMNVESWEVHAWAPDDQQAPRPLDSAAQMAYRLSTVEASIEDDESLRDFHRRVRGG